MGFSMDDQVEQPVEHTIPVAAFVKGLKGTPDEVYTRLLLIEHKFHNKTVADWTAALDDHRGRSVENA